MRAMWNVEQHTHKKLNEEPIAPCQMSFWDRFMESHAAMAALHLHSTPADLSQTSSAWQWPFHSKVGGARFDTDQWFSTNSGPVRQIHVNFILNCKMY